MMVLSSIHFYADGIISFFMPCFLYALPVVVLICEQCSNRMDVQGRQCADLDPLGSVSEWYVVSDASYCSVVLRQSLTVWPCGSD